MAALTFADLLTEVYDHTGLDSSDANNIIRVGRWLNYVQQDICSRWPWPFLLGREALATIPDYTTGTASVSSASTAVTGSSTVWTSTHGDGTYYIQFAGTSDWYNVTARSSNTAITIGNAYAPTTAASAVAYTLRKFFYSLSSSADEILDVRNWNTPLKLIQVDFRTIDLINPLAQSASPAYGYLMFGTDSSGNQVFMPYPFPTDSRLFEFRTRKRPTDMTGTALPSIPNKFAQVIAFGAVAVGFAYLRKFQEAAAWDGKYETRIAQMKKDYRQSGDYQPVLSSIDSISRSRWVQMPSSYPVIGP